MCAGLCHTYWTTFATLRKIEMVAVLCTNETTPIFWVFNSPPPPSRGRWTPYPRGGGGTLADIVPTQIKFDVDASTRCWDISLKNRQNAKIPHRLLYSNENFISPFSARRGPPTPKRGEDTFGTRVRLHAKYGLNRPTGGREIVDKKANKKHTVNIYLALRSNERMAGKKESPLTNTLHSCAVVG